MIRPGTVGRRRVDDLARWLRRPPTGFQGLPPLASWDRRLARVLPIVFAVSAGFQITKYVVVPQGIGFDARLYTAAAREWLAGGDPWSVSSLGIPFGAPPPTLLAFAPFAPFPDWFAASAWILGSFALAFLAIRALGLPWWWITFFPIVDAAMVGNPDVALLALLVIAHQRLAWLAPILKIYAAFPLVSMWRWKALAVAATTLILTAPLLPWSLWFTNLPSISEGLERYADTTSVWGNVPLMLVGIVALAALGFRRAGWLIVPVLWPWTQPHYLAMSVPILTPTLAIIWSIPGPPPLVMLASVVLAAIGFRVSPQTEAPNGPGARELQSSPAADLPKTAGPISTSTIALAGSI